jgi:hypothetical protein
MTTQQTQARPQAEQYQSFAINANALGSLLAGIFWMFGVGSFIAIILGHTALRECKERKQDGSALAKSGLVLGYLGLVGVALFIILMVNAETSEPSIYDY